MSQNLQFTVLGSGTILSVPERTCSSYLIKTAKDKILIDAGPGTMMRMAEAGIKPRELTYIFVTHFHPDHVSELVPLIFSIKNPYEEPLPHTLRIWGPRGFINFMHGLEMAYGKWLHAEDETFHFYELKRKLLDFPGFRLIWSKVLHKQESVAFRFEIDGHAVIFSGDTGYCSDLTRLCRNADLAFMDCSFPDDYAVEGHLSPSLVAKIAQDAKIKEVVLSHFYPGTTDSDLLDVMNRNFDGNTIVAKDLITLEINRIRTGCRLRGRDNYP